MVSSNRKVVKEEVVSPRHLKYKKGKIKMFKVQVSLLSQQHLNSNKPQNLSLPYCYMVRGYLEK